MLQLCKGLKKKSIYRTTPGGESPICNFSDLGPPDSSASPSHTWFLMLRILTLKGKNCEDFNPNDRSATSTAFILSAIKCLCFYFLPFLVHCGFGIVFPPWLVSVFVFYASVKNQVLIFCFLFMLEDWKRDSFTELVMKNYFFIIRSTQHYYCRSLARTQKRFNYSIFLTTILTFALC